MSSFSDYLFCYAGMESPAVNLPTYYFDYINYFTFKKMAFQPDLTQPLACYESVIHFAIQIAYYLGFKEIYLLGVDLDFAVNKGHCYQETNEETQRQLEHSINSAEKMLFGIEKCGQFLDNEGVQFCNASPKGIVDCIKRVKYEELF